MFNSVTQEKIRQIPQIGNIDTARIPEELTRIFAQIVSLRQELANGIPKSIDESLEFLRRLASNLETMLITGEYQSRESIAFVAATAHSLIFQAFERSNLERGSELEIDSISSLISATILFLIGNSQADAAEVSRNLSGEKVGGVRKKIIDAIKGLAQGNLQSVLQNVPSSADIISTDLTTSSVELLWLEIGKGIDKLANQLLGRLEVGDITNFDRVINLSSFDRGLEDVQSIFCGPLHLAKLFKELSSDFLSRGIVFTPTPAGSDPIVWRHFLEDVATLRPFLWENHQQAIQSEFLDNGVSAVLTLPTGAGKTTLSELKIAACLFGGKKVLYLVPTHALKDQVNRTLAILFKGRDTDSLSLDGEYIEIEYGVGDIMVMTPERCLSMFNISPELFDNIGLVVFDEFHLIHGTDPAKDGRAIDAMFCLISLFEHLPIADYLMISAMVENGSEIAAWIESITHRKCVLFNSSWKPTRQLHGCLVYQKTKIESLEKEVRLAKRRRQTKTPPKALRESMRLFPRCIFSLKNIWETEDAKDYYAVRLMNSRVQIGLNTKDWRVIPNRNSVAGELSIHFSRLGLKTLVFVDSPKNAIATAKTINGTLGGGDEGQEAFFQAQEELVEYLRLELGEIKHSYIKNTVHVGVHHGALLPTERFLIEEYFKSPNGCSILIATATLAQGINLPAEVVIIAGDDRFDDVEKEMKKIEPHVLLNAAGRAGRAGLSSQGAVIIIPGRIATIEEGVGTEPWSALRQEVFSKPDQCLVIQDPLQRMLDSMQNEAVALNIQQVNFLYRLQPSTLSDESTKAFFSKSLGGFRARVNEDVDSFESKVDLLIERRDKLAELAEDMEWIQRLSYKTGIEPAAISSLEAFVDHQSIDQLQEFSIPELLDKFVSFIAEDDSLAAQLFNKDRTRLLLAKLLAVPGKSPSYSEIVVEFPKLKQLLSWYISGEPLNVINAYLKNKDDEFLKSAREFVLRLVPDISFICGILAMVISDKASTLGITRKELSIEIKSFAACVREGFDTPEKLFHKIDRNIPTRVATHISFNAL